MVTTTLRMVFVKRIGDSWSFGAYHALNDISLHIGITENTFKRS